MGGGGVAWATQLEHSPSMSPQAGGNAPVVAQHFGGISVRALLESQQPDLVAFGDVLPAADQVHLAGWLWGPRDERALSRRRLDEPAA